MPSAVLARDLLHQVPGVSEQIDPSSAISAPYSGENVGILDIPDATLSGTEFTVPFGSIAVGATLLVIKNTNNQDVILTLNGSANLFRIAPGGFFIYAAASQPAGVPLLSASVKLTAVQSGAGTVQYHVFGE
jgi:hypothetical protein